MKSPTIIFIIIAVIGLAGTGYFFTKTRSLESKAAILQDAKLKVETELAALKNTDLGKENALLKSELKTAEDALALEKREHGNTQNRLTTAEGKIKDLETAIKKAQPYIGALSAFNDWQFAVSQFPLFDRDTRLIDAAVSSLSDNQVSDLWREAKASFPEAKQTGKSSYDRVIILITSNLAGLLR